MGSFRRWPFVLGVIGSLLGFAFALTSTSDYVQHLDRQVHDIHCSFIPGAAAAGESGQSACKAALYSPYSSVMKDAIWGGIPISIFALGSFACFAAFSLYFLLRKDAPRKYAAEFFGLTALTPLCVSGLMAFISATKLGEFCKTCTGIYVSSGVLAVAAVATLIRAIGARKTAQFEAAAA